MKTGRIKWFAFVVPFMVFPCGMTGRGAWEEVDPLSVARSYMTATYHDGKVFVIGGSVYVSARPVVDVYDSDSGALLGSFPLPEPRTGHDAVLLNDRIYCMGGLGEKMVQDTMVNLDTKDYTWRDEPPMPGRRDFPAAEAFNGRIYVFGGEDPQNASDPTAETFEYNPDTRQWVEKAKMPEPRYQHSSVVYGGEIYVFGGKSEAGGPACSEVFAYSPETDRWRPVSTMPCPRTMHETVVVGKKILIVGGRGDPNSPTVFSTFAYTPASNRWVELPGMIHKRYNFACAGDGRRVFAFGGTVLDSRSSIAESERFSP